MGFYIQDDYWESVQDLPVQQQKDFLYAICKLFFTGEEDTMLKGAVAACFGLVKDRVCLSHKRSNAAQAKWDTKAMQTRCKRDAKADANTDAKAMQNERDLLKSEKESESNKKEKPVRHKYGLYENVLLSDDQLAKLKAEFPNDWKEWIESVSEYCAKFGKSYKDYLAVIRSWAKKEKKELAGGDSSADLGEYASAF